MVSPEEVGERYLTVQHRMHRIMDEEMSRSGLSLARTKVLVRLRRGPARQNVLAAEFGVSPHTITEAIDALERDGLVERQADPTDRRAKLVTMTSAGGAAFTVAAAARGRLLKQIFGALGAEDRETLFRLLATLDAAAAAKGTARCPAGRAREQQAAATAHAPAAGGEK
jgi:DNA-binding MarR family transcriptional regulator